MLRQVANRYRVLFKGTYYYNDNDKREACKAFAKVAGPDVKFVDDKLGIRADYPMVVALHRTRFQTRGILYGVGLDDFVKEMQVDWQPNDYMCDICQTNPALGAASSRLTAMSCAVCRTCIEHNAEMEAVLEFQTLSLGGSIEFIDDQYLDTITTYKDGAYITWRQWWTDHGSKLKAMQEEIRNHDKG